MVALSPAYPNDALPVDDGWYMRSKEYCDQFRTGKLDMIEFEVLNQGRSYGMPEVECHVATAEKIRPNRYLIQSDCVEAGERWEHNFLLDTLPDRSFLMDGMTMVFCGAQIDITPSDKDSGGLPARDIPMPRFTPRPKADASGNVIRPSDPNVLIEQWYVADEDCRGASGGSHEPSKSCDHRADLSKQLDEMGWCFGRSGQSHSQYEWHRCAKGSVRFN